MCSRFESFPAEEREAFQEAECLEAIPGSTVYPRVIQLNRPVVQSQMEFGGLGDIAPD